MGLRIRETTFTSGGSSSRSDDGNRKAKRTFIVEYDGTTPPASYAVIETADDGTTAIPAEGSGLAGDLYRIAVNISVKPRDDTGLLFDVEVDYEIPENEVSGDDDPLTAPVDYDWDFSASSQPYYQDQTTPDPKSVVNAAGEPFENLLEAEEGEIVVTVTDNIVPAAWNPILAAQYMRPKTAINNAVMTIDGISIAIGQARFGGARCSGIRTSGGVDYRTRTIVLKLRESWDHVIENRGFHEKYVKADGNIGLKEIVKGTPPVKVDKPWPLEATGVRMANATDVPPTITFKPHPLKDFGVWGVT